MAINEFELLVDIFLRQGDWLITWMTEEFEGWAALLHDTSMCPCHAEPEWRCDYSGDPSNLTRAEAEFLIGLGVDSAPQVLTGEL